MVRGPAQGARLEGWPQRNRASGFLQDLPSTSKSVRSVMSHRAAVADDELLLHPGIVHLQLRVIVLPGVASGRAGVGVFRLPALASGPIRRDVGRRRRRRSRSQAIPIRCGHRRRQGDFTAANRQTASAEREGSQSRRNQNGFHKIDPKNALRKATGPVPDNGCGFAFRKLQSGNTVELSFRRQDQRRHLAA